MNFTGDYSLEKLVERAVRQARPHCSGKQPRWCAVKDVFGWGSTTSVELCLHFGLDPHEEIEGCFPKTEEEKEAEAYEKFVESMVPHCHCREQDRPCDGVLAGGICDDIQDEPEAHEDEQARDAHYYGAP